MAGGVLVYGEALADLLPEDGEASRYEALPGGSGFNTALTLARCGAPVAYCATLSRDALGRRLRSELEREGVDLRFLAASEAPTPLAVVAPLRPDGAARYHFHLAGTAQDEPPPLPNSFAGFDHLHLTSFGATVGPSGERALVLMRAARAAGLSISYDLNIRPPALPGLERTFALIEERVALCDLVKLSEEDRDRLLGAGYGSAVERWFAHGCSLVLLTRGETGAELFRNGGGTVAAAAPAPGIVDTIGAGDAFMGALLAWLRRNDGLGRRLRDVPEDHADAAMRFAAQVAAEICAVRGCDPPRRLPERAAG